MDRHQTTLIDPELLESQSSNSRDKQGKKVFTFDYSFWSHKPTNGRVALRAGGGAAEAQEQVLSQEKAAGLDSACVLERVLARGMIVVERTLLAARGGGAAVSGGRPGEWMRCGVISRRRSAIFWAD
jgi:hypothetical protein